MIKVTNPSFSIVFLVELAVIVVVKSWVAIDSFLLTQLMVLSLSAIYSSIYDLKKITINKMSKNILHH